MGTSLRKQLNDLIRERTYVPAEEVYRYCLESGYKPSNGERRLRKSESPDVEPEMGVSKSGTKFIKGYWFKGMKKALGDIPLAQSYRPEHIEKLRKESLKLI